MKDLSLADFELVARLADRLSVAAVARERNVPPSQVSRGLQRIEAACGQGLFHRSTHGLSLTAEGRLFAAHAQRITQDAEALADDFSQRSGRIAGTLRLSISTLLGEQVLLPALGGLADLHPALELSLNITDRLVDLASEGVDLAVRAGVPPRDTFVARRLGGHRRCLYAAPAYLGRHGTPADLAALAQHRLISNTAVARHNQWHFVDAGQPLTLPVLGRYQADSSAAVLALALAGLGIARLNDVVAAPHVARGALQPVLADLADPAVHEIHAVTLAARQRAPRIRAVMDWLQACFAGFGFLR